MSKLKPFHGVAPAQVPPLAPSVTSTHVDLQPLSILGVRSLHNSRGTQQQILVQWQGLPELESTWEDTEQFRAAYPAFDLEDKVIVNPRSDDTGLEASRQVGDVGPSNSNGARPKRTRKSIPLSYYILFIKYFCSDHALASFRFTFALLESSILLESGMRSVLVHLARYAYC